MRRSLVMSSEKPRFQPTSTYRTTMWITRSKIPGLCHPLLGVTGGRNSIICHLPSSLSLHALLSMVDLPLNCGGRLPFFLCSTISSLVWVSILILKKGLPLGCLLTLITVYNRHHRGLSPTVGPSFVQCVQASAVLPCCCRRRCRGGIYQVVVSRTPRAPPIHGYRP